MRIKRKKTTPNVAAGGGLEGLSLDFQKSRSSYE